MTNTIPSCMAAAYDKLNQDRAVLLLPVKVEGVGLGVRVIATDAALLPEQRPFALHAYGSVRAAFLINYLCTVCRERQP